MKLSTLTLLIFLPAVVPQTDISTNGPSCVLVFCSAHTIITPPECAALPQEIQTACVCRYPTYQWFIERCVTMCERALWNWISSCPEDSLPGIPAPITSPSTSTSLPPASLPVIIASTIATSLSPSTVTSTFIPLGITSTFLPPAVTTSATSTSSSFSSSGFTRIVPVTTTTAYTTEYAGSTATGSNSGQNAASDTRGAYGRLKVKVFWLGVMAAGVMDIL